MKSYILQLSILFLIEFLIIGMTSPVAAQEMVRAKIGIELFSGNGSTRARTVEHIKTRDKLRIHVISEKDTYVYVVHTDQNKVTLLNKSKIIKNSALVLPPDNEYYLPDGLSETELFTVICSPDELTEMSTLFSSKNVSYSKWSEFEKRLVKKSRIDLEEKSVKPFEMAGNVRGNIESSKGRPVWSLDSLPLYSGKSLLVKKFRFNVKK